MAVTTFTMQDVVNGVLKQLRYAPGRDVQIHLQDSIVQDASILYRSLMLKYTWRDFINVQVVNIDSTTGLPIENISANLDRFTNLLAIFPEKETQPLQFAPALVNFTRYNRPCILPASSPNVYQIQPAKAMKCVQWSRIFKDTDFEMADTVPFYMDILVVGTAHTLVTKSGINKELEALLKSQFDGLIEVYREQEIQPQYQVNQARGSVPMEWYSYDN